jgi:hypothetical protein
MGGKDTEDSACDPRRSHPRRPRHGQPPCASPASTLADCLAMRANPKDFRKTHLARHRTTECGGMSRTMLHLDRKCQVCCQLLDDFIQQFAAMAEAQEKQKQLEAAAPAAEQTWPFPLRSPDIHFRRRVSKARGRLEVCAAAASLQLAAWRVQTEGR